MIKKLFISYGSDTGKHHISHQIQHSKILVWPHLTGPSLKKGVQFAVTTTK